MKMRNPHNVPLPDQALELLEQLRNLTGNGELLFPSLRSWQRPMSENTLNAALRRMGYSGEEMTAHGFRASFSTLANESGLWNPDAIERALAHVEKTRCAAPILGVNIGIFEGLLMDSAASSKNVAIPPTNRSIALRDWVRASSTSASPGVAFTYAPGRGGKYADDILQGFSGILQVDGYADYNCLLKRANQDVQLAYCWAHAQRKLHDVAKASAALIAQEGLKQIAAIYRIETDIKGLPGEAHLAARIERTKPKIEVFEKWLAQSRARVSAKPPTGEALKYFAKYWNGLNLFLTDGRIEIDNNPVGRTIRPIALSRKKCPIRWSRSWSPKLGHARLVDRNLQTEGRGTARIHPRYPYRHHQRSQTK